MMAGQGAGDGHDVETDRRIERPQPLRLPCGRRGLDPAARPRRDGQEGGRVIGARLHLDKGDEASAPGDQVDLARMAAEAALEDAVALEAQEEGGERLGPPAGALGRDAARLRPQGFRASARA